MSLSTPVGRTRTPVLVLLLASLVLPAGCDDGPDAAPGVEVTELTDVGFLQPAAAVVDTAGDVYLISNIDGVAGDRDRSGFISRVSPDGQTVDARWIDLGGTERAMNSPTGMAIRGDTLLVADLDCIRIFHRETGEDLGYTCLDGVSWLTDVDVGPEGSIFVTDGGLELVDGSLESTGTDAVYRLVLGEGRQGSTLARGMELGRPAGIAVGSRGIFVTTAESGEVYRLTPQGERTAIFPVSDRRLGGIVFLPDGGFAFTSWSDEAIFLVRGDGRIVRLLDGVAEAGGLSFDPRRNRLVVPLQSGNRILFVDLADAPGGTPPSG
jgi:DNA-binding beta-propeller fold protein YncE